MSEHSDVMPGPANPAMQAGGHKRVGGTSANLKNDFYLCYSYVFT